ncbi:MAG: metallophosphoesterase [Bacteroidales bacterium]
MKSIGILSDTHSSIHKGILNFFLACDEIWHIGDIGSIKLIQELEKIAPVKGVYGNIDDYEIQTIFPEINTFEYENTKIAMIHIGGYPGRYSPKATKIIKEFKPKIFLSGHSHILKAIFDKKNNCLHLNPGAAGRYGFHKVVTAMRLKINNENFSDLEIFEAERKASKFLIF